MNKDCEAGIESIKRQFMASPLMQHKRRVSAVDVVGSSELAWRRGQQSGQFGAYKVLKKKFPKAAEYLLKFYGMNKKGGIRL